MNQAQRKACITELDQLTSRAKEIKKELGALMSRQGLHRDPVVGLVYIQADQLVGAFQAAATTLKLSPLGVEYIHAVMTDWYHFHVELDVEEPADPVYESVTYQDNNTVEIVMSTPTDGRQKAVVHSDGATWDQVYSVDCL
jgi:hypothetical protein